LNARVCNFKFGPYLFENLYSVYMDFLWGFL
jgi:hypothetical protein